MLKETDSSNCFPGWHKMEDKERASQIKGDLCTFVMNQHILPFVKRYRGT